MGPDGATLLEYRPLVPLRGGRHHRGSVPQNGAAGLSQGRDPVLMASLPDLSPGVRFAAAGGGVERTNCPLGDGRRVP